MAGAGYWISPRNINRNVHVLSFEAKTRDYAKKNELPLMVNYPPFTYCTETSKINAVSFFWVKNDISTYRIVFSVQARHVYVLDW